MRPSRKVEFRFDERTIVMIGEPLSESIIQERVEEFIAWGEGKDPRIAVPVPDFVGMLEWHGRHRWRFAIILTPDGCHISGGLQNPEPGQDWWLFRVESKTFTHAAYLALQKVITYDAGQHPDPDLSRTIMP